MLLVKSGCFDSREQAEYYGGLSALTVNLKINPAAGLKPIKYRLKQTLCLM